MDLKMRIKKLCSDRKISMNKLEDELSFGKGYISKLGASTPNTANLKKIAEYFGVTIDYLMGIDKCIVEDIEPEYINIIREFKLKGYTVEDLKLAISLLDMARGNR